MIEFLVGLVAGIYLLSAIGKLTAPRSAQGFVGQLGVPARLAGPVVLSIATVELLVSGLVYAGWQARGALTVAALLGVGFVLAQVAGLRGHMAACRCFGKLDADLSPDLSLARAAALALFCLVALWRGQHVVTSYGPERWLASLFGAATFVVCFHLIDEVRKFRRMARASHEALLAAGQQREGKHVAA